MIKKLILNLVMLAVSLLIAALLGEAAIRFTIKDQIVLFPRYHTNVEYGDFEIRRFRENSTFWHTSVDGRWRFETNDKGLRGDVDIPYEKPDGTIRVLALGDSHTAGYEVGQSETYSSVLESLLNANGYKAEVINSGISGFGTAESLVYLENEGVKYSPDVVVLAFYANDFEDNVKSGLYSVQDGELLVQKTSHVPGVRIQNALYDWAVIRWLSENSYFYSFMFNMAYELAKSSLAAARKEEVQTEYAVATGNFDEFQIELAERLIRAIGEFSAERNIRFIVVDIPRPTSLNTVDPSLSDENISRISAFSDDVIEASESALGVAESGELIHVANGHRHISAATHAAIAQAVFTRLDE